MVVGVTLWGKQWQGKTILARSDNAAVVAIVKSGSSKDNMAMELVQPIFCLGIEFDIMLTIEHVPGIDNKAADALSRQSFLRKGIFNPEVLPVGSKKIPDLPYGRGVQPHSGVRIYSLPVCVIFGKTRPEAPYLKSIFISYPPPSHSGRNGRLILSAFPSSTLHIFRYQAV